MTDEGCNGLAIHAINDGAAPIVGRIELTLYRDGDVRVGHGSAEVVVPARGAIEVAAATLFEGFFDLSYAYRFGPPQAHVAHARLFTGETEIAEAFHFPAGLTLPQESAIGLTASVTGDVLTVASPRFAQFVTIEVAGAVPEDNGFHLAPGQTRAIRLRGDLAPAGRIVRGTVAALNAQTRVHFEIHA
jgi:beta-mannosidase